MTKPSVTRIRPRFISSIRQHIPFVFGQKGFGVDIVSIIIPPWREVRVLIVEPPDLADPQL